MPFSTMNDVELMERRRVGVYRLTLDGQLSDCNESCALILGYDSREEMLNLGQVEFFNETDFPTIASALKDLGSVNNLEVCLRRRNGTLLWVTKNLGLVETAQGTLIEAVLVESNESHLGERFEHQVTHDPLSGLPNRSLFMDRLVVALAQAQRRQKTLAVCVVDLDHFDLINATFGRGLADRILKIIGDRLVDCLRLEDTVARFGSDEFALMLSEVDNEVSIASIAQRILDTISRPAVIDGHEIHINASLGVAIFPTDGVDPETLLRNADTAMYRAKDVGRNTWQFYEPEVNARAFERQVVVRGLRTALERDELSLHYQPQINVQTGEIDCVEALLRWDHPELGLVPPGDFLPAAEQGGLILKIGEWVVRTAARQVRTWSDAGLKPVRVAVNLSWRQFQQPDLIGRLGAIILEEGLDPSLLELEISERTMQQGDRTITTLLGLKNLGVRLALDDFGTGQSSLSDLKRMPFDTVKIDTSYVKNVMTHSDDAALVHAVIMMARALGLRVVAEGVETKAQLGFLREKSCVDMQGFFFGKPKPAYGMEELLRLQH